MQKKTYMSSDFEVRIQIFFLTLFSLFKLWEKSRISENQNFSRVAPILFNAEACKYNVIL